jgi:hypothetical protein
VKFSGDLIRYMRDENVRKSAGTMLSDGSNKYSLYFLWNFMAPIREIDGQTVCVHLQFGNNILMSWFP